MTRPHSERLRIAAIEHGGLLALVTLIFYMWLAPPHIVDGDNAEFSTLGMLGGTAHPSGYPLYLLWLRAMQWLPGATPAHTAALATAIIGAAAVLAVHAACRAWGARPLAATITAAIFAAAPIVIRGATRAEVFALNNLAVATVLWLAAQGGPLRGAWRSCALGLVAGLGLANHMTCALIAPVGILGVIRGARESRLHAGVVIAAAVGALVVGLLPYAYLLITPDTPLSWGTVRSADELYGAVTRRDYGGAGAFLPGGKPVPATAQLAALAMTLGRTWLWAPLAVGLYALGLRVVRPSAGETRWAWGLLAASWLIAGPLLATRFNLEPVALGLYVIQRFHALPAMLLAVPIAVGLSSLAPYVSRVRLSERAACVIAATLGFLAPAGLSLPHVQRMHTPAVERYARNVLASLPPNAVIFAGQDGEYFGMNYVQLCLHERPDVTVISWQLIDMPWYAKRMTARGIYLPEGTAPPLVRVVDYLLSVKRPVFIELTRTFAPVIESHVTYPYGPVVKVLPPGEKAPSLEAAVAENKAVFEVFTLDYPRPGEDDEFATAVHKRYAATWWTLARKLDATGKREEAAEAAAIARDLGPQP